MRCVLCVSLSINAQGTDLCGKISMAMGSEMNVSDLQKF